MKASGFFVLLALGIPLEFGCGLGSMDHDDTMAHGDQVDDSQTDTAVDDTPARELLQRLETEVREADLSDLKSLYAESLSGDYPTPEQAAQALLDLTGDGNSTFRLSVLKLTNGAEADAPHAGMVMDGEMDHDGEQVFHATCTMSVSKTTSSMNMKHTFRSGAEFMITDAGSSYLITSQVMK